MSLRNVPEGMNSVVADADAAPPSLSMGFFLLEIFLPNGMKPGMKIVDFPFFGMISAMV
jgi:hypothetical protein